MSKKLIIFGSSNFADLAFYCLTNDSIYKCCAFTVDKEFCNKKFHHKLPLIPFDSIQKYYPPEGYSMIIPLGFKQINELRKLRFEHAKKLGYNLISYLSSRALIWPDFEIKENLLIYENAIIQPYSKVGQNTIIRSGSHISHHCNIGNNVFIAAGAILGGNVTVKDFAVIGLGATIKNGVTIGKKCFIGAGAVVLNDTEPNSVYVGNPAKKLHSKAYETSLK